MLSQSVVRESVSRDPRSVDTSQLLGNIDAFAHKLETFMARAHRDVRPAVAIAQEFIQLLSFIPEEVPVIGAVHKTALSEPFTRLSKIVSGCVHAFVEYANEALIQEPARAANVRSFLSALEHPEIRSTAQRVPLIQRGVNALSHLQRSFKNSGEGRTQKRAIQQSSFAQAAPLVVVAWFDVPPAFAVIASTATIRPKPLLAPFKGVTLPGRRKRP